jgi:hypothetical protein
MFTSASSLYLPVMQSYVSWSSKVDGIALFVEIPAL